DEGGVLRDLVHEVDYALWLLGRPSTVVAMLTNTGELGIESEEAADLGWTAPGGAVVSIRLDYLSRVTRRRLLAIGEAGELELDLVAQQGVVRRLEKEAEVMPLRQDRDAMMQ